jgi:hypothetical protein
VDGSFETQVFDCTPLLSRLSLDFNIDAKAQTHLGRDNFTGHDVEKCARQAVMARLCRLYRHATGSQSYNISIESHALEDVETFVRDQGEGLYNIVVGLGNKFSALLTQGLVQEDQIKAGLPEEIRSDVNYALWKKAGGRRPATF